MIYIQIQNYECEEIKKYSMFQWILFVIHKLTITRMIGLYVNNQFSLYNWCLETAHIKNQTILHFVHMRYKEFHVNISYPSIVNQIDGYLDSRISPNSVIYIMKGYKQIYHKKKKTKIIQGGDIHRLLQNKIWGNMANNLCE